MQFTTRSLSPRESRVVLALVEQGKRETTRAEIAALLSGNEKAADDVIRFLRRKGWLERATWGRYLLIPPEQGPDALGDSNLLALASRIVAPYYIGFSTAASHYGLTTQHRGVIFLVTPKRPRARALGESRVRIVSQSPTKFFGFGAVDVLGYNVMMSDREKTVIDCIDHPEFAGGVGEVATIVATASRRFQWNQILSYISQIGSGPLVRRFGWFLDHVNADFPPEMRARLISLTAGVRKTWLGPNPARARVERAMGFDEAWRVFVNVPKDELQGTAGLGRRRTVRKET